MGAERGVALAGRTAEGLAAGQFPVCVLRRGIALS